jgi:hypothetical protein
MRREKKGHLPGRAGGLGEGRGIGFWREYDEEKAGSMTVGGNHQRAATLPVNDWGSAVHGAIIVPERSGLWMIQRNPWHRRQFTLKSPFKPKQLRTVVIATNGICLVRLTRHRRRTSHNHRYAAASAKLPGCLDFHPFSILFPPDQQISFPDCASAPNNDLTKMKCSLGTAGAMVGCGDGENQPP